jgi:hypothetical protein
MFQTCHRVTAYKWNVEPLGFMANRRLCASDISDKDLAGFELIHQSKNFSDRRSKDDEIGRLRAGDINDVEFGGFFENVGPIDTGDSNFRECSLQGQRKRTSDQARAVNCDSAQPH